MNMFENFIVASEALQSAFTELLAFQRRLNALKWQEGEPEPISDTAYQVTEGTVIPRALPNNVTVVDISWYLEVLLPDEIKFITALCEGYKKVYWFVLERRLVFIKASCEEDVLARLRAVRTNLCVEYCEKLTSIKEY